MLDTSGSGRVEGGSECEVPALCSWAWNQESCVTSRDLGAKGPLGTRGCTHKNGSPFAWDPYSQKHAATGFNLRVVVSEATAFAD
jgi:hypothetical protein